MRSSQDGKWMMRWLSTGHLMLLNKRMKFGKRRLQCTISQSAVSYNLGQNAAAQTRAANIHADT